MNFKNYSEVLYRAFLEKSEEEFDIFLKKFIKQIKIKKISKILPKIFKYLEKKIEIEKNKDKTVLILKSKDEFEKNKKVIEKYKNIFNLDNLELKEDKKIIGGYILKNSKKMLDNSYKNKLLKMYKKII